MICRGSQATSSAISSSLVVSASPTIVQRYVITVRTVVPAVVIANAKVMGKGRFQPILKTAKRDIFRVGYRFCCCLYFLFNGLLGHQLSENVPHRASPNFRTDRTMAGNDGTDKLRSLKECCYGNHFWPKMHNWSTQPSYILLALQNGLVDRNADVKRLNGYYPFASVKNSVCFGFRSSNYPGDYQYRLLPSVGKSAIIMAYRINYLTTRSI